MASLPRSQDPQYSQGRHAGNASGGSNTAPMNELPVEVVIDTQAGGIADDSAMGRVVLQREGQV